MGLPFVVHSCPCRCVFVPLPVCFQVETIAVTSLWTESALSVIESNYNAKFTPEKISELMDNLRDIADDQQEIVDAMATPVDEQSLLRDFEELTDNHEYLGIPSAPTDRPIHARRVPPSPTNVRGDLGGAHHSQHQPLIEPPF
jgi:hypothetical protein